MKNKKQNLIIISSIFYIISLVLVYLVPKNPIKVTNGNKTTQKEILVSQIDETEQPITPTESEIAKPTNKIAESSKEQIISKEVKFGEYIAYIRNKNDKNEVVLIRNGQESIIDSGDNDWKNKYMTTRTFSDPTFSPMGTYLIYSTSGWEWSSPTLYEINKEKKVNIDLSYADIFFTKDEKYLISCTSAGIGSGVSAIIYAIPSFSIKKDFKDIINNPSTISLDEADCSYSSEKSEVKIVLSYGNEQIKTIKYNLISNQEIVE